MNIDPSKVNLSEADIEEYLWQNPSVIHRPGHYGRVTMARWLFRQLQVPSGIIDLVGQLDSGRIAVVEVKNVEIDAKAITQVCRYAFDLHNIIEMGKFAHLWSVERILVGPKISGLLYRECEACNVDFYGFDVVLRLDVGIRSWTQDVIESRSAQYRQILENGEWDSADALVSLIQESVEVEYAEGGELVDPDGLESIAVDEREAEINYEREENAEAEPVG